MGRIDELVSAEFARWEQRGRGWKVWPEPVQPEPAFQEFTGYQLQESQLEVDDSRRPGLFASLFDSLERSLNPKPPPLPKEEVEPEPAASQAPLASEFAAALPAKLDLSDDVLSAFLGSFQDRAEPAAFELRGSYETIAVHFAVSSHDAPALRRQLAAFFPQVPFVPPQSTLTSVWNETDGVGFIVDFALAHEFMLPLQTRHAVDPFVGLVAVLNELQPEETGVFQVLFQPVQSPWPGSVWRAVTDTNGKALFVNRLNFIPSTKEKLDAPLFGAVVRAAAKAANFERAAGIVRDIASSLRVFTRVEHNRLIPLHNEDYEYDAHEADLLARQSRRGGMLLNRDELLGFVHLPSDEVRAPKLRRERMCTKAAPAIALSPAGVLLGHNRHLGKTTPVYLSAEQRTRHTHIIGASGSGKSTLLFNLIRQDIEKGDGIAVLDPHGDLVERILGIIPKERIDDVVLVDPSDEEYSVGFNILHAHSNLERTLLASDLVSVFRRLSTSWGDQMDAVLKNAILAFLHNSRVGTLMDLRRFLIEDDFRAEYLKTVQDPEIVYYWRRGFPLLAGTKSVGPIVTRLNDFLVTLTIRCMVSQPENRLDFAAVMDTGKIFLAKLPKGLVGEKDGYLLGSLLVSKFQQVAMSRQAQQAAARRDFWIYADEFDNFITPSMAQILKGTRKYRVGLTLAHHELHQLQRDPEVANAVMSNTSTRVVFRVGDDDARKLSEGFASFEARDLQNLSPGEAIARVERSEFDFNVTIPLPEEPNSRTAAEVRKQAITASRQKYAVLRTEVEAALRRQLEALEQARASEPSPAKRERKTSDATKAKAPEVPPVSIPPVILPPPIPQEKPTVESKPPIAQSPIPEVPQPVDFEKEQPAARPPEPATVAPTSSSKQEPDPVESGDTATADAEPTDNFHDDAKKQIADAAAKFNFSVSPEQWILQGKGRVDLVLERGNRKIACEVCDTSTAAQEIAHITARLQAGFTDLAVVCRSHLRLSRIQQKIDAALPADQADCVGYYHLAEFISQLREWARQDPAGGEAERAKLQKRNIRLNAAKLSGEERERQEKVWLEEIARAMKIPLPPS